eukprot:CAMPEP_0204151144 /NCGR_PEP_ID=MMETSP0361-20130328/25900_1 /ASSEMBLY_ACC=CAM_ASM_000343 /TAXON_ID=268821 /ORGANISM="Scrippsiella Hangoei, Strain SHTV-5" /LENGTH=168 /DNA_ID=CAMNT_0051105931 /DNA_START=42 /DNA_END=548 /DNA_ORIENTATION=+
MVAEDDSIMRKAVVQQRLCDLDVAEPSDEGPNVNQGAQRRLLSSNDLQQGLRRPKLGNGEDLDDGRIAERVEHLGVVSGGVHTTAQGSGQEVVGRAAVAQARTTKHLTTEVLTRGGELRIRMSQQLWEHNLMQVELHQERRGAQHIPDFAQLRLVANVQPLERRHELQ